MIGRAFLVLALLLAVPACAGEKEKSTIAGIIIQNPATLATPMGVTSAAIYIVIDNPTMEPDELTGASSSWAQEAELNATAIEGDKTRNFFIPSLTALPASTTVLGPGGSHIKLKKLRRTLQVDDEVPVTINFQKAGPRSFKAIVMSGRDLVKTYPVETTILTLKRLQAEQGSKLSPLPLQ